MDSMKAHDINTKEFDTDTSNLMDDPKFSEQFVEEFAIPHDSIIYNNDDEITKQFSTSEKPNSADGANTTAFSHSHYVSLQQQNTPMDYYAMSDAPPHSRPYSALVSATSGKRVQHHGTGSNHVNINMNQLQSDTNTSTTTVTTPHHSKRQKVMDTMDSSSSITTPNIDRLSDSLYLNEQSVAFTHQNSKNNNKKKNEDNNNNNNNNCNLNSNQKVPLQHVSAEFTPPHAFPQTSSSTTTSRLSAASDLDNIKKPLPSLEISTSNEQTKSSQNYSRKNKALGLLAQRLVHMYEQQLAEIEQTESSSPSSSSPSSYQQCNVKIQSHQMNTGKLNNQPTEDISIPQLSIDQTASHFLVERRRIYDIINILEALKVVSKKGKNMYYWHGLKVLQSTFSDLQTHAIHSDEFRVDAEINYSVIFAQSSSSTSLSKTTTTTTAATTTDTTNESYFALPVKKSHHDVNLTTASNNTNVSKVDTATKSPSSKKCSFGSLGQLTKKFLSLYMVGYDALSLGEATERLLGCNVPKDSTNNDGGDRNCFIASSRTHRTRETEVKGWKTKVRRLYDIANVLSSIGIIDKTSSPLSHNKCGNMLTNDGRSAHCHKNNQYFYWKYPITPRDMLIQRVGDDSNHNINITQTQSHQQYIMTTDRKIRGSKNPNNNLSITQTQSQQHMTTDRNVRESTNESNNDMDQNFFVRVYKREDEQGEQYHEPSIGEKEGKLIVNSIYEL